MGGAMMQSYSCNPKLDYFPVTTGLHMFDSSCTIAVMMMMIKM